MNTNKIIPLTIELRNKDSVKLNKESEDLINQIGLEKFTIWFEQFLDINIRIDLKTKTIVKVKN